MTDKKEKREDTGFIAIIPATVRYDETIPPGAKLLYGEISALAKRTGESWARNEYFAELYKTSERTIIEWIKRLREAGHINIRFEYFPGSKKIKRRYISLNLVAKKPSSPEGLVVKESSPPEGLVVKKTSPPSGEENSLEINTFQINTKAAAADLSDQSFQEPKKPSEKAATALFDTKEIEKLKTHVQHLNKKLVFDEVFYPKLLGYLSSHGLGLNFVSWMYELCARKNPRNISGYLFKIFFEERYVELFRESSTLKETPPAPVSCPVCGKEHKRDDPKCPSCGLPRNATEKDIAFKKAFLALPEERQKEFEAEQNKIYGASGIDFKIRTKPLIKALKEEFGLPLG